MLDDGVQMYPQSITDAIADVRTRSVLSDLLKSFDDRIKAIEMVIGSGSTTEFIDNLNELLQWFSGTTDGQSFTERFVEAKGVEDNPNTHENESTDEFPSFNDIFGENNVPSVGM